MIWLQQLVRPFGFVAQQKAKASIRPKLVLASKSIYEVTSFTRNSNELVFQRLAAWSITLGNHVFDRMRSNHYCIIAVWIERRLL